MTKKYGILAYPAKHSLSPVMHNAAFKALGIDAEYGIFEVPENELPAFMEQVKHEPIDGLSVSLPYKEVVMNYMNEIDEDAGRIGAVNTVVNRGGFLYGYNTDFLGSNRALMEVCGQNAGSSLSFASALAVVIGAGGAARAIIYGLLKEGAEVVVVNRNKERAEGIVEDFSKMFGGKINAEKWPNNADAGCKEPSLRYGSKAAVLLQASSIWFETQNEKPFFCDSDFLASFEIVMDIHYKPLMTPLLVAAEKLGKKVITGEKMLLYQAMEQFKLWTGKEAPMEMMRNAMG